MSQPKYKVLIAEDEAPMAQVLSRKLSTSGFDVTTAANGKEALSTLEKGKFDLILLDLTMPEVDGFQVLAELKQRKVDIPILVMSNLSQPEDIKKAKELGAVNYLVKVNITPQEIAQKVSQCILEHKC